MNGKLIGLVKFGVSVVLAIALCTLGMNSAIAAPDKPAPEAATAKTLLQTAYDNRYTWDKAFPGYLAEVAVRYQNTYVQGAVLIEPTLQVATQHVVDKDIRQVITAQLQMTASQLQPTTFEAMHGQYQFSLLRNEDNTAEIEEKKDDLSARYIVKNNEIMQVNRDIGKYIIEIKTIDSMKASEGYLQTHFQATFRDSKTAAIAEQDDVRDSYEKVGSYYLLAKREIRRGSNVDGWLSQLYPDTTLRFTNFQLLPAASTEAPSLD
jgi:AraC-like DNA-binding protein